MLHTQTFLEDPAIIELLNDETIISSVIFKKRDGTVLTEAAAIAEDAKFDPTTEPAAKKRTRTFDPPAAGSSSGVSAPAPPEKKNKK